VQGAVGVAGTTGPQGPQGVQGAIGPQGPQGVQGATGPAGPSPTQVASLGVNATVGPTGDVRASGNIIAHFSDERLKEIIGSVDNALGRLQRLNGVYYNQNSVAKKYGYMYKDKRHIGLIAQEVAKVLPEVIRPAPFDINKHGHSISGHNYMTVMYERIVPLLIEALKEQKDQIDKINSIVHKDARGLM
jgi:hypothetical protein